MGRPTTVKVLSWIYSIYYGKDAIQKHQLENGDPVSGFIVYDSMSIYIDGSLPEQQIREVLLHELQHAVFYIINCAIENPDEEQYVTIGTPILLATLKDPSNKDVFDYIFG